VIVPDLAAVRSAAERIFDDILHPSLAAAGPESSPAFHVSAGPCLVEIPVISAAFTILSLGRPVLDSREASVLLRSPFFAGSLGEESGRALLDADLRRKGFYEISLRALAHKAERWAPNLARWLHAVGKVLDEIPRRQGAAAWSRAFSQLLRTAGWPGDRTPNSFEHQAIDRWNDLLSEFAPLDLVSGSMEYDSALARLRRMAAGTRFAPADEGAPVQIMGMLEAAGSTFDHLWVTGLEDRVWPQPPRPNPFLPAPLQRSKNLPHCSAERELVWARQVSARLLTSAREVVFSYPLREADTDLRPSPLILNLPEGTPAETEQDWLHALRSDRPALEEIVDAVGPAVPDGTKQRGGTAIIEKQAACPFRAFAEFRLGARALDEPSIGLSIQERGQIAHLALRHLWGELKSHEALVLSADSDLSLLISRSVQQALMDQVRDRGAASMTNFQSLEQERLESLLAAWLEIERERAPFAVVSSENAREVHVGGLNLEVKIDRVDALPDGRHVIIDYKTGKPSPAQWESDRPEAPQLPLYAATHETRLAAVAFAQLVQGESGFKGIGEDAGIPGVQEYSNSKIGKATGGTLTSHISDWRRILEQLALEFRSGNAVVAPERHSTCEYCALPALCRIADAGAPTKSEEDDE
jgi:probable DNA repair protein